MPQEILEFRLFTYILLIFKLGYYFYTLGIMYNVYTISIFYCASWHFRKDLKIDRSKTFYIYIYIYVLTGR